jgi:hypothetical protein
MGRPRRRKRLSVHRPAGHGLLQWEIVAVTGQALPARQNATKGFDNF